MRMSTRFLVAAIVLIAAVTCTQAQPAPCPWPGPIAIVNNSTLNVTIDVRTTPQILSPIAVNSGATVNVPITVNTTVDGIVGKSGTFYPWIAPPPPPWRLSSVDLDGSGSCYDVTYNPATCTITITMSTVGPPCTNP